MDEGEWFLLILAGIVAARPLDDFRGSRRPPSGAASARATMSVVPSGRSPSPSPPPGASHDVGWSCCWTRPWTSPPGRGPIAWSGLAVTLSEMGCHEFKWVRRRDRGYNASPFVSAWHSV